MKKNLLLLILLSVSASAYSQIIVKGVVKEKSEKSAIPGASIHVKGTLQGTSTDGDGKFNLNIASDTATLVFSFVGLRTKEVKINNSVDSLEVLMKWECNIDFFEIKHFGINYYAGVVHTPLGGLFELVPPSVIRMSFQLMVGYQTDLNQNKQIMGELGLNNFIADCYSQIKLKAGYNRIEIKNLDFDFTSYRIWSDMYFSQFTIKNIHLNPGIGLATLHQENSIKNYVGYELGISKYIHIPSNYRYDFDTYFKITYWSGFWQFQGGIEKKYKRCNLALGFNKIKSYTELNIRAGYDLEKSRRKKKQ
jgi:hypothetical protein